MSRLKISWTVDFPCFLPLTHSSACTINIYIPTFGWSLWWDVRSIYKNRPWILSGNALFKHLASKCDPLAAKAKETKERSDPKKNPVAGGGKRREGKTWNPEIRQKLNGTYTNGTPFSKLRSSYILRFRGPFSGSCWRSLGLKTNILTLKIGRNDPKGEVTEPNHLIFRGEMLVSGSVVRKKDASTP